MAFKQLVRPWWGGEVEPGACLVMAQLVVGAPGGPFSATAAADATAHRHYDLVFPDDATAILWFSHWGTYTDYRTGRPWTGDWGHVVHRDPNHYGKGVPGYFSSRRSGGEGPGEWFRSIADIEREFSSRYRFWSEDINGVRVIVPTTAPSKPKPAPQVPSPEEDDEMKNSGFYYEKDGGKTVVNIIANTGSGFYTEYGNGKGNGPMGGSYNNPLSITLGTGPFAKITESHAAEIKRACAEVRAGRAA